MIYTNLKFQSDDPYFGLFLSLVEKLEFYLFCFHYFLLSHTNSNCFIMRFAFRLTIVQHHLVSEEQVNVGSMNG